MEQYRGTTILSVRRNGKVVINGDGQVGMGNTVMKGNARKVRRLYKDQVIAALLAVQPMHSLFLSALKQNWKNIRVNSPERQWSWQKIGTRSHVA